MFATDLALAMPRVISIANAPIIRSIQQRPRLVYKDDIIIEADIISWHAQPPGYSLKGNVVASRGNSTIHADQAELDQDKMEATFAQNVKVTDPVGEITASKLTVSFTGDKANPSGWIVKDALAVKVVGKAHEAHFVAESISQTNGRLRIKDSSVWLGEQTVPDFRLEFKSVAIKPGDFISSNKAFLRLGNGPKLPLPFFRQSLKPGGGENMLPKISFNSDLQPRLAFRNTLQLGDRAGLSVNASARFEHVPISTATLAYSLNGGRKNEPPQLRIDNPDGERFLDGYMDNVLIESKEVEQQALGKKKALLFAGSGFNGGSSARPGVPVRFDRDWFGGLDWGDSVGSFALAAQLRYGAITDRKVRELENRLEFYPSIITPSVLFGQHEWMRLRADSAVFGVSEQYGWVRGMLEIGSDLSPQLTACFGVASSFDWGSPHFDADRLYSEHALHFRTDLKLPASKLSILAKYDMDRKKLYDVEITLRQSIRSLEPFISYRSFPGSLSFGLSLRMDKLLKALQARRD